MAMSASDQSPPVKPQVFVLVHPAWHGAWCWKLIVPLLRNAGHLVVTPTLTGLGERQHLARADVGLETHVTDVVNILRFDDLTNVVLVGHSSSGGVITGVADRAPERIAHIVYLDAFVPNDGQSVFDLIAPERRHVMEHMVQTEGDGWRLPRFAPAPWATIVREIWGVTNEVDVRWIVDRLVPTPFGHFKDPIRRTNAAAVKLPRTFVRFLQFKSPRFDQHAEMAQHTPNWRYRELRAPHHALITVPGDVTKLLMELAV